jgi:hypothetical protein
MAKVKKVNIAATYFGNGGVTLVTSITYDSRVINYYHNHVYSTVVQAIVTTVVNYDCNTFIV